MKFILLVLALTSTELSTEPIEREPNHTEAGTFAEFEDLAFLQKDGCCKICKKGKACGDTCIAVDKTCHAGSGCACDR